MENLMEAWRILAGSWPVAAIIIGTGGIYAVRKTVRQSMDFAHEEQLARLEGNRAVVVQPKSRRHADD